MLPTPSTSHVSYDTVYEPAEDSYLFLDTLSSPSETAWLQTRFSPRTTDQDCSDTKHPVGLPAPLLVEIGPGSGVIVAFLTAHARAIFGTDVLSLAVDVNGHACTATRMTVDKALEETKTQTRTGSSTTTATATSGSIYLSSLTGDLTSALRNSETDILIFNPPYVPTDSVPRAPNLDSTTQTQQTTKPKSTPSFEESSHLLSLSYAGGVDGMEVTNRLLREIPERLSERGVAYVLFCRGNRPEEVKGWIRSWEESEGRKGEGGWRAETVGTSGKTAGWEKLEIVRIWREWNGALGH